MPDAGKGPSFRFSSFSQCVSSGWKRGDGKQLIKEQGTLPYRERPFCFGLLSGAPDGGLQAFPYGGWDISGGGVSSVDRYIGERIEARGLREDRSRGASAVGHGGRMPPPAWRNQEGRPPVLCGDTSLEKAREGHGQRGRQGYFLLRALWFRPRRPGSRTRRAGPADHASCLRADRPCGRDVPDIAPDPSPVPRAPAAGRRPGACPGAAAGRDGR